MLHSLCIFNSNNLNVETCISELVKISLRRKASFIAIRFNPKKYKIQVIDNGFGFTKYELLHFFDYEKRTHNKQNKIFHNIIIVSNALIITSRNKFSSHTYVMVKSANKTCKIFEGYHRPSKGTTVSIYGFNISKWSNQIIQNYSISYVIAAIAFVELKISFSLRNDEQQKIILNIKKFHNPWEVLKYLKSNKTYKIKMPSHSIFQLQENKITLNSKKIEHNKRVINTNSLNICSNLFFDDQVHVINSNIYCPLSEYKNWLNDIKYLSKNVSIKFHRDKVCCDSNQINIFNKNFVNLSQMSIWSNWSYHPKNSSIDYDNKNNIRNSHYKFLPISIYKILPYKHCNILDNKKSFDLSQYPSLNIFENRSNNKIRKVAKYFQNKTNIRICNLKCKFNEYTISVNSLNSVQILKQINKEFIVAITNENKKKLLIIMDQHAIHERIRYEWLIETYREKKNYNYLSVKLRKELWISDIDENLLKLIFLHKKILTRVGINLKAITDSKECIVDAVPKCFIKKMKNYNYEYNLYRLIKNVRLLLLEVANGLVISKSILPPILPITIHNVIASEACHEAIKFGDPLSIKECILLIQALQDTKAPTRCAHGRPSIIPLADLSNIEQCKIYPKVCIIFILFIIL